jgi:hypothetical protein
MRTGVIEIVIVGVGLGDFFPIQSLVVRIHAEQNDPWNVQIFDNHPGFESSMVGNE